MKFDTFFCGLCKKKNPNELKRKIIFFDPTSDSLSVSDFCSFCSSTIRGILNSRPLTEKQTNLLESMGIELKEKTIVSDVK